MARYQISKPLAVQVNVYNALDKKYYDGTVFDTIFTANHAGFGQLEVQVLTPWRPSPCVWDSQPADILGKPATPSRHAVVVSALPIA